MFTEYTKQQVYNILKQNANALYVFNKALQSGMTPRDISYMAPEQLPEIQSTQVKTMLAMQVEILSLIPIEMDYIVEKIQNGYLFGTDDKDVIKL